MTSNFRCSNSGEGLIQAHFALFTIWWWGSAPPRLLALPVLPAPSSVMVPNFSPLFYLADLSLQTSYWLDRFFREVFNYVRDVLYCNKFPYQKGSTQNKTKCFQLDFGKVDDCETLPTDAWLLKNCTFVEMEG